MGDVTLRYVTLHYVTVTVTAGGPRTSTVIVRRPSSPRQEKNVAASEHARGVPNNGCVGRGPLGRLAGRRGRLRSADEVTRQGLAARGRADSAPLSGVGEKKGEETVAGRASTVHPAGDPSFLGTRASRTASPRGLEGSRWVSEPPPGHWCPRTILCGGGDAGGQSVASAVQRVVERTQFSGISSSPNDASSWESAETLSACSGLHARSAAAYPVVSSPSVSRTTPLSLSLRPLHLPPSPPLPELGAQLMIPAVRG